VHIKQAVVRSSAFALLGMAALAVGAPRVQAQIAQHPQRIAPTALLTVAPADTFEWPKENLSPSTGIFLKPSQAHWHYNMSPSEYAAMKQRAAQGGGSKPGNGINPDRIPPPTTLKHIYEGMNENQATDQGFIFWPPDVNAAVSTKQVVETCNDAVAVYTRTGVLSKLTPMSTFMLEGTNLQTDPNVEYDPTWQRWIVSDVNDAVINNTHTLNLAISKTSSATGAWWVYHIVVDGSGGFWDYPHSGQTQDAVILTGNLFFAGGGAEGRAFAVAKARLFNGLGFSVPLFTGLPFNFTPPNVMDQSDEAYCAHPDLYTSGSNQVWLYDFGDAANAFEAYMIGPYQVATNETQVAPPSAPQPGTSNTLDTLDGRFQYRGQQNGNRAIWTNCIALGSFSGPVLYDINTSSMTLNTSSTYYFDSGTSFDFNPNAALLPNGNVGVEWSYTDPSAGKNASIQIAGGASSGISGVVGTSIFTSGSNYADFRWGDYSSLQLDPASATQFWGANEYIINSGEWGTKIFYFSVP